MQTVKKLLSEIHPLEKNVRNHGADQIQEFVRSLQQFGQTRPFVVDEHGTILVGNGMYAAMISMGVSECDCYVMTGMSEVQKKKLVISDNKVFDLGQTNYNVTDEFLREIVKSGDTDVAGFQSDVLESIVNITQYSIAKNEEYGKVDAENFKAAVNASQEQAEMRHQEPGSSSQQDEMAQAESHKYVVCPDCGKKIII